MRRMLGEQGGKTMKIEYVLESVEPVNDRFAVRTVMVFKLDDLKAFLTERQGQNPVECIMVELPQQPPESAPEK